MKGSNARKVEALPSTGSPHVVIASPEELARLIREAVRAELEARDREPQVEWLDTRAAAELLHVHPRTVQKLVRREGLKAHRVGKLFRFRRHEVEAWIEAHRAEETRKR